MTTRFVPPPRKTMDRYRCCFRAWFSGNCWATQSFGASLCTPQGGANLRSLTMLSVLSLFSSSVDWPVARPSDDRPLQLQSFYRLLCCGSSCSAPTAPTTILLREICACAVVSIVDHKGRPKAATMHSTTLDEDEMRFV